MKTTDLKFLSENLIETFNIAGEVSKDLYKKGLKIEIKEDSSPVSNGDLEVNDLITWQEELNKQFYQCILARISVMTPEQAVKKGFLDSVDQHPKHKDYKKVA